MGPREVIDRLITSNFIIRPGATLDRNATGGVPGGGRRGHLRARRAHEWGLRLIGGRQIECPLNICLLFRVTPSRASWPRACVGRNRSISHDRARARSWGRGRRYQVADPMRIVVDLALPKPGALFLHESPNLLTPREGGILGICPVAPPAMGVFRARGTEPLATVLPNFCLDPSHSVETFVGLIVSCGKRS